MNTKEWLRERAPSAPAAFVSIVSLLSILLAAGAARGAGLYYADRGVRPLGRGGAFIAGADDLGAIAYNPAGLFDAGGQLLLDASWFNFSSDYTRQAYLRQDNPNTGRTTAEYVRTFESVEGTTPFLPIPTLAASLRVHRQWVVAAGAWVPYAALTTYPSEVRTKRGVEPAPQRYSLLSLDGSALALLGVGAAYAPTSEVRVGATVGVLTGLFRSTAVFSGCVPGRPLCAPEDPNWDVLAELSAAPIVAPTGQLGAIWAFHPKWRVGASFQLPVWVRSPATIRARLPSAPIFAKASQEGEDADINFELPWSIRLGLEARLIGPLRVELGAGYDRWSMHDTIEVDPDGVALKNVIGFPELYHVPRVALQRGFRDTFSVRAGGEYAFSLLGKKWDARAGVAFDSSAIPPEYLSVLTLDSNKVTTSLGVSLHWGALRFDATYAHVFAPNVTVAPEEARAPQVSPLLANPPERPNYINGGIYSARANIIGLGLVYAFDPQEVDAASVR